MNVQLVNEFETEVERYGVSVVETSPEDATATIEEQMETPAVGVPLDMADLPEDVTTDPTPAELDTAVTGITEASLGIASYGSIGLQSDEIGSEPVSLFIDHHIALLDADDVVPDMETAFGKLGERFREQRDSTILATGPSATADMGALVQGAHGPKDVTIILLT